MKKKILFLDTETGGLDPDVMSLLSIGLVAWESGKIVDTKEIFIKHDVFKITPQAIATNKIDLVHFVEHAISPSDAAQEIVNFIECNYGECLGNVIIGGHNTNFDINFLKKFMSSHKLKFSSFFSHRFVDTSSILKFLYYAGKFSNDISSSDAAFQHFNIYPEKRHSALGDAVATAKLFTELIKIVSEDGYWMEEEA
ncbi:3'-5' exonuclease [Anaerospora hongkongensis]|uniref:3'-5' exonuclease n=1 Tax=Anaerospora hongkongensis TaxID=244830 RepID=UPI00289AFDF0|nr:3'-5' exonuclease [Anaerospora hongkongensis]